MGESACRLCDAALTPPLAAHPALCQTCWRRVPARLRIAAVTARRGRRSQPVRHQEAQIAILQWCWEQSAGNRRDESTADNAE